MSVDFEKVLEDAGVPTTAEALKSTWAGLLEDSGSEINNDSLFGAFYKALAVLITTPVLFLVGFVAKNILPNLFISLAVGEFLDLLADGLGLVRKPKTFATGVVTFTRSDVGTATTINEDTIIKTATLNGTIYQLITTEQKSFIGTDDYLNVAVIALQIGAGSNLGAGYYSILEESIANIVAVENGEEWLSVPGTEVETDDELRQRLQNQFGTASSFHTDAVYRSMIAEFPGVDSNQVWFEHTAPRGPGSADAYVLWDFATDVSAYLIDINAHINDAGNHGHGDDLRVFSLPTNYFDLVVSIWVAEDFPAEQTTIDDFNAAVETFIFAAFRENQAYEPTLSAPFSRFSFSKLGQELHREFDDLHSVEFDLSDIVSDLWVPRLNPITLNFAVTE